MLIYNLVNIDKSMANKYLNKDTIAYVGYYQDNQKAKIIVKNTDEIIGDISSQDIERLKYSKNVSGHISVRKKLDNTGNMQYYCVYYHDEEFKSIDEELMNAKEIQKSNTWIIIAYVISFLVIASIILSIIHLLNN